MATVRCVLLPPDYNEAALRTLAKFAEKRVFMLLCGDILVCVTVVLLVPIKE